MALDEDIIIDFRDESRVILGELLSIVDELESGRRDPKELLREFSQKIDRIMGAAMTLHMMEPEHQGLGAISKMAEFCKILGYKAADLDKPALTPVLTAFWADALEILQPLLRSITDRAQSATIAAEFNALLDKRLDWLADRIDPSLKRKR